MKKKMFLMGMLSIILAFGIMVIGCSDDSSSDDGGAKKIKVTNITVAQANRWDGNDAMVGVFKKGTTIQQALNWDGLVAGGYFEDISQSGSTFTATAVLYDIKSEKKWTGSGTYDIYVIVETSPPEFYQKKNVSISSSTTSISVSSTTQVNPF